MIFEKDKNKKGDLSFTIWECYTKTPNLDARKAVERLLRGVPEEHLEGLQGVILCDTEKLKEHYGESEKVSTARYIILMDGSKNPWIEICIDRLFHGFPKWVLKFSAVTDLMLSQPFYHEIGHHISAKSGNNDEDAEKAAEKWRKKFSERYMLRYHFLFCLLAITVIFPFKKRFAKMYGYQQYEQV